MIRELTVWERIAAASAIALGVVFLLLGAAGLFFGARAHFTLPPVLGALPLLPGWAMVFLLVRHWRLTRVLGGGRIFVCPRCQKTTSLSRAGKLQCRDCGLRLEIFDPLE